MALLVSVRYGEKDPNDKNYTKYFRVAKNHPDFFMSYKDMAKQIRRPGLGSSDSMGNINQGVVTMTDSSGNRTEYRYERCGGDCIYFGNNKFAIEGPANCR